MLSATVSLGLAFLAFVYYYVTREIPSTSPSETPVQDEEARRAETITI